MRTLRLLFLALIIAVALPAPQAKAIDPVTIAILGPIAMKAAAAAKPYLVRAGINSAKCMWKMFKAIFEMGYFPYGLGKMACGNLHNGLIYTFRGCIAPCKLILQTLLLPVYMIGIDIQN